MQENRKSSSIHIAPYTKHTNQDQPLVGRQRINRKLLRFHTLNANSTSINIIIPSWNLGVPATNPPLHMQFIYMIEQLWLPSTSFKQLTQLNTEYHQPINDATPSVKIGISTSIPDKSSATLITFWTKEIKANLDITIDHVVLVLINQHWKTLGVTVVLGWRSTSILRMWETTIQIY